MCNVKSNRMDVGIEQKPDINAAAKALHDAQRPANARHYVGWEKQVPEYQAHMRNRVRLVLRTALAIDCPDEPVSTLL